MNIQLTNFKCHDSLVLSFPDKAAVLICGQSGQGKSSIIQGIAWVLYGCIKKIAPFKATSIKTTVVLTLDNMVITRTKNPKYLSITHNTQHYENQEAQKKIDNLFGVYDVWLATSYVMQKKENFFLDTSNTKKMEVLNSIVFQHELPSTFITIIDKALEKNKYLQEVKLDLLNKKLSLFNEEELNLTANVIDYDKTINDLNKSKQELQSLMDVKKQRDINLAIKNNKEIELQQLQIDMLHLNNKYYFDYPDDILLCILDKDIVTKDDVDYVENIVKVLSLNNDKLKEKNRLEDKLSSLTATNENYTNDYLEKIIKEEHIYNANDEILRMYELPHDQHEINECIAYFYEIINSQDYLALEEKMNTLVKQYDALENNVNIDTFIVENEALKVKLNNYTEQVKNASNALECPHCHCHVLLQQQKLIKVDSLNENETIRIKKEIDIMAKEIYNNNIFIQSYHKDAAMKTELAKQIETIKTSLSTMSKPVYFQLLTFDEKEQTFDSIRKLKNVVIINKPTITSVTIKNAIEYHDCLEQFNAIKLDYDHAYDVKKLSDIYKKLKEKMYKHNNITEQINKIMKKINSIVIVNDPEEQIISTKNNIVHLELALVNHKKALKVIKEHDELSAFRGEVMSISQKLEDLSTLKQYAIDIECKILQNIIDNINVSLFDICNMLFQDCVVELSLYKTLKNKQENTKPFVHFTIYQKGNVHDSTNELSGGELDRLSLAITLALHKLSPCPFIMFDELAASLNDDQKNIVINTIKEHTNCTTLYVQHGGIQGVFDTVINVDTF